jgi:hypothetical protein
MVIIIIILYVQDNNKQVAIAWKEKDEQESEESEEIKKGRREGRNEGSNICVFEKVAHRGGTPWQIWESS